MESIIDNIEKTNSALENIFKNSSIYNEFKDYYNKMNSKGLIKPEKYSIPPIDTIGARFYQIKSKN
jgi:hypothetical protein